MQAKKADRPAGEEQRLDSGAAGELSLETRLRIAALPLALLLALWFHATALGHFLQRTFLTMMVHEGGHAATAWLCGYGAFPFLWRTWIAESRGPLTMLLVFAAGAGLLAIGLRSGWRLGACAGAVLLVLQLWGTAILRPLSAQALITFGGDGGALVFGTLLMMSFFFGRGTQLYRGGLRWGFLVIGAAAFVDTFATWWQARRDPDVIPFGEIEGVGLSDPSKLTDVYGWPTHLMINRYVGLGVACLLALACVWVWGIRAARNAGESDFVE